MEELIGINIDRAMQFLYQRRFRKWQADAAPFETHSYLGRFMVLASMIAGKEIRVADLKGDVFPRPYRPILQKMAHPALLADHGFAWTDGETIFLPISIIDMHTEEEQEDLVKLIVFFLAGQIRDGSLTTPASNRNLFETDNLIADIYWIVENCRLSSLLIREFPGMRKKWEGVITPLAEKRPGPGEINAAEQKVEELLEQSLFALSNLSYSKSSEESLLIAGEIKERWLEAGVPVKRYRGMVPFPPWGRLVTGRIKKDVVDNISEADNETESNGGSREKRDEAVSSSRYMTTQEMIDEEENEQGLALNIYDKLISWARFVNVARPFDDEPDKDAGKKAEEMEELTLAKVSKGTNSFLDAHLEKSETFTEESPELADCTEKVFVYPEWDYRSKSYRDDYSMVTESTMTEEDGDFVGTVLRKKKGLIREVKRKFESLTPAVTMVGCQFDGDSIDMNAVVEAMVDMRAGKQPDDRLYTVHKREERDISAFFLLDLSMSTESWVKERPIIDHEKEALVVLCEAMETLRDRYAVYGFSGRSRKGCEFFHIKGFQEPYSTRVKKRINGMIPCHYTRMGPAIRHATSILGEETAKIRFIFVLSDGKPNDIDEYEGRYGIDDTRMAIREAEKVGIVPFCLTLDSKAGDYLPRLFGRGNYAVVSGVDGLAKKLPDLYARITKGVWM